MAWLVTLRDLTQYFIPSQSTSPSSERVHGAPLPGWLVARGDLGLDWRKCGRAERPYSNRVRVLVWGASIGLGAVIPALKIVRRRPGLRWIIVVRWAAACGPTPSHSHWVRIGGDPGNLGQSSILFWFWCWNLTHRYHQVTGLISLISLYLESKRVQQLLSNFLDIPLFFSLGILRAYSMDRTCDQTFFHFV